MWISRRNSQKCYFPFQVLFALFALAGLTRAGNLTGTANLSWNLNPETNIAGYRILYGTTSAELNLSQTVNGNISYATVSGLETGQTYYFAVLAYNFTGLEGLPSDQIAFFVENPTAPEISIERPPSAVLAAGQNNTFFGEVKTGTASTATEFVIRNTGTASLTGLVMEIDGANHPDFSISTDLPFIPILTSNAAFDENFAAWTTSGNVRIIRDTTSPGGGNVADFNFSNSNPNGEISQSFATTPGASYTLTFDVGIFSFNSNPQAIRATATGVDSVLSETILIPGSGNRSTQWESHRFTFVADSTTTQLSLTDVSTTTDGADLRIDTVRVIDASLPTNAPAGLSLEPGESSSFWVAFSPSSAGAKAAYLHILSNDSDESPFNLTISGTGLDQPQPPSFPEIEVQRANGTNLLSGTSNIPFQDTLLGSSVETETLVITNTGSANLTSLSALVAGVHADDFSTEPLAVNLLAPGESTTLRVHFKPASVGSRSAELQISSNDEDEPLFGITLTGNGTAPTTVPTPEISVGRANGINLNNHDSINFSGVLLGTASVTETLTVRNTGTAALAGLAITLDGNNTADFIVGGNIANSLAAGASASFTVIFRPTSSGTRSAVVRITSNDADENPFDIALSGNGIAVPEIAVEKANGIGLTDAASTIEFNGITLGAASAVEVLTLRNSGTGALTGIAASISGSHAADFILEAPAANTLLPGSSTTMRISFRPTSSGTRSAVVRITSNDADENPFDIALSGNGIAVPEIAVEKANGIGLTDAASTIVFNGINLGAASAVEVLTLRNSGTGALTGIAASISGSHAADFILEAPGPSSLSPGSTTTMRISFRPTSSGTRSAIFRITSNDADENPFDITLSGNGIAVPNIAVASDSWSPGSPAAMDLGSVRIGASGVTKTFTISNSGTASLTGVQLTLGGPQAVDFVVESSNLSTLPPGSSTTFRVSFRPTDGGVRSATLHISSNDPDTNPYAIVLSGNGLAVPQIALFDSDGSQVLGGSKIVSFNPVDLGSVSTTKSFIIRNTGSAPLADLATITDGIASADFLVSALETTTLAPGSSTSFTISFKPLVDGFRSSVLHLTSNDPESGTLSLFLTGIGSAFPMMELELMDGTRLEAGTSLPDFGSVLVGSASPPLILRIKNNGTAVLPGLSISAVGPNSGDFTVTPPAVNALEPGAETSFDIVFKPSSDGAKIAVLTISNDHSLTAPFEILLTGSAIAIPAIPAIALFDAEGSDLSAGTAAVSFGNLDILAAPKSRTFTIRNTGSATLTGVQILKEGANASDFSILPTGLDSIAPGTSANFSINFKPTAAGNRSAFIRIVSNAGYDIVEPLSGKGLAAPEIKIEAADKNLRSGESFVNFGTSQTSVRGETRSFTISNIGSANLERISLLRNGIDAGDFIVTALKTTTLAPGKSTTFNVSFKPSEASVRWAEVNISSNDMDEKSFIIGLTGRGTNKPDSAQSAARAPASLRADKPRAERGIEIISGRKYRTLTIYKLPGANISPHDIEVSADLTHWSSGPRHTTVLRDTPSVLTVRDNTATHPEVKRHIRLRP